MLVPEKIRALLEDDHLEELEMEAKGEDDGYITTYHLPITFRDDEDKFIGDLIVYFKVIGFGIEGFDGGVDTYFNIPVFHSGRSGEDEYFEDAEAFQFIFNNFGEEIQNVIDEAIDMIHSHYEDGTPLGALLEDQD